MTRSQTLAARLREVFLNGRWIANTNYKEQLAAVGCRCATEKIGALNTIAALAFHIDYYLNGLVQVAKGGPLDISDKYSFDAPPPGSEEEWAAQAQQLLSNAEKFAAAVEAMEDDKLDTVFVDGKYGTWLRNIEGVLEHSYYHLGQTVLLARLTSGKTGSRS